MYYDSFASRTGPAAMPSPHSKIAPYFSGRRETFDNFLEEFEARAYDCRLTDSQQVDALVCYVDPSLRETCESLNGYRSCDWNQFRRSLIHTFSTITSRPEVMKQKLCDFVEDSSRMRMDHEDDVLQYYRTFLHYSDPLVHSRHMSEEDRDIEFWYGFHPRDRDVLRPRLLALHPFKPHDIPFRLEHVYDCACRAFAYEKRPSFWPREQEFEPRSVSRKYSPSFRSDPRLGPLPSFSHMFSESLSKPAPSASEDKIKPEPETTFSITPPTSLSMLPMTLLAASCTNVVPDSEPESTSIILPTSPSLPLAPSLQSSCTDVRVVPEPESISEHASLYSFPSTSSLLSIPSLPALCTDAVTEPEHMPSTLPMSPIPPSNVSTLLTLPSESSISSTELEYLPCPVRSAMEVLPKPEFERSASSSPISPAPSPLPFDSPPPVLPASCESSWSSQSQSFVLADPYADLEQKSSLSPVDHVSLSASKSSLESCEAAIILAPAPFEVSNAAISSRSLSRTFGVTLGVTPHEVTPAVTTTPPLTPPLQASAELVPSNFSDHSSEFLRPPSTIGISSTSHDHPSSPGKLVHIIPAPPLEASNVPSTHSSPSQPPYEIVQDDSFSDSLEDSLNIPIPFHLSPSQPPPGFAPIDSFSPSLEVTLVAPTSQVFPSIPQQQLTVTPVDLISSPFEITSAPVSPALPSFEKEQVSSFVTAAVLVFWSKIGSTRISTTMPGNAFDLAQLFRLAQQTARPARLVFDPGGLVRFKHYTKTFASASRSHTSPSSPRTTPASLPSFQAIVSSLFSTETRNFSLVRA